MATVPQRLSTFANGYPTGDGKPMAETDQHRELMFDLIHTLRAHYAADPNVYVSGNLLLFYERGNRRRHVSPDVFVVRGVPKRDRINYLLWEERPPEVVVELTSSSTRRDDLGRKRELYRDVLRVREYFLFDPLGDYLDPRLQGFRLRAGRYGRIRPVQGRLPSNVLGLHLGRAGDQLRLYDPVTGRWLPTPAERTQQEIEARQQEAEARQQEAEARQRAEAEVERLRQELERLQGDTRSRPS